MGNVYQIIEIEIKYPSGASIGLILNHRMGRHLRHISGDVLRKYGSFFQEDDVLALAGF